jgi:hypothetical protein
MDYVSQMQNDPNPNPQAAVLTGWLDRCCRSCCFLLVFFYMFMTRKILTPLTYEPDAGDGEEYLTALPFAKCPSTDRGIASILLVTHVIGLPVAMIFICRRLMRQPDFKERALYIFAVWFGGYAPRMPYFEAFYLLRQVSFVAAASLIPTFSALGSLSGSLILGISLVLSSRFQPFQLSTDNLWDISSLSLLLVNVVANVRHPRGWHIRTRINGSRAPRSECPSDRADDTCAVIAHSSQSCRNDTTLGVHADRKSLDVDACSCLNIGSRSVVRGIGKETKMKWTIKAEDSYLSSHRCETL